MESFLSAHWRILVVVGGFAFLLWLTWWVGRPRLKKKANPIVLVVPPENHIAYLISEYKYDRELAEDMWHSIRNSVGYEDFYATRIYAHKKHVDWYLPLPDADKRRFDYAMLNCDLTEEMQKESAYQACRGELLKLIWGIRSYKPNAG